MPPLAIDQVFFPNNPAKGAGYWNRHGDALFTQIDEPGRHFVVYGPAGAGRTSTAYWIAEATKWRKGGPLYFAWSASSSIEELIEYLFNELGVSRKTSITTKNTYGLGHGPVSLSREGERTIELTASENIHLAGKAIAEKRAVLVIDGLEIFDQNPANAKRVLELISTHNNCEHSNPGGRVVVCTQPPASSPSDSRPTNDIVSSQLTKLHASASERVSPLYVPPFDSRRVARLMRYQQSLLKLKLHVDDRIDTSLLAAANAAVSHAVGADICSKKGIYSTTSVVTDWCFYRRLPKVDIWPIVTDRLGLAQDSRMRSAYIAFTRRRITKLVRPESLEQLSRRPVSLVLDFVVRSPGPVEFRRLYKALSSQGSLLSRNKVDDVVLSLHPFLRIDSSRPRGGRLISLRHECLREEIKRTLGRKEAMDPFLPF